MRRAVLSLCAAGSIGVAFCGGRTTEDIDQPPGHVSADGGFVGPDGGPVFVAGSKCTAYDTSNFDLYKARPINCSTVSDCVTWAAGRVPQGYPTFTYCESGECGTGLPDVNEHQIFANNAIKVDTSVRIHCTPGPDGDAFCSAYFSQFILGEATTVARCIQGPDYGACAADQDCYEVPPHPDAGPTAFACDSLDLCVTRGSSYTCEPPCQVPN